MSDPNRFSGPARPTRRHLMLTASALLLAGKARAQGRPDPSTLPAALAGLVPATVGDRLTLQQLDLRGAGWRDLEIPSPTPAGKGREEKVSIQVGARGMYALDSGQLFVNLKVERSQPGHFARDRALCEEALRNAHARKLTTLTEWNATAQGEQRRQLDARTLPDLPLAELDAQRRHGIELLATSENIYGLSGVPTMALFLLPQREVIATAYLLHQRETRVSTLAQYRTLRDGFLDGYALALARAVENDRGRSSS